MADVTKVLIANRGEIARRIQKACKEHGIQSVCVASEADRNALFVREAEEVEIIGPAAANQSYLNINRLIEAAKRSKCDAIHPGYGFLSENYEFAKRVCDEGLTFIGPKPETIQLMGSKTEARAKAIEADVPCTPGCPEHLSDEELAQFALEIGYPVLIKAVGGGGGRGMRVARSEDELLENLPLARGEAGKFFGNESVFIEKFIELPRHVEVQVFGDSHGNALHFGTRDCSTQRRHQKVIEEAPAPNLSDDLRERIHTAAVNITKHVGYIGAGTVEFLVKDNEFYFLEMNTRIQVEHPVSEEVTGVDLVRLQLDVAQGNPIPFSQDEVIFTGHSIEYRIYAEDASDNFRPATGKIYSLCQPKYDWVREDYAIEVGDEVSPHYDAMISKVIITGENRQEALERSRLFFKRYEITGIPTTVPFHRWFLTNQDYLRAPVDITYLERTLDGAELSRFDSKLHLDPKHIRTDDGTEFIEYRLYTQRDHSFSLPLEIRHLQDGTFLVSPVDRQGKQAQEHSCRRSNCLQTAIEHLVEEVLESQPLEQIFF